MAGMIRILAIDPSLTRTGYALADGTHGVLASPYGPEAAMMRLFWIRERIAGLCSAQRPDVVVIEGYSFASEHSRAHAAGELGGVIRLYLFEAGIRYVEVAPASLKKFATGKGNSNKDAVLAATIRRLGYMGSDNNEGDALWLRQMALHWYGAPEIQLPATHTDALASIRWPSLQSRNGDRQAAPGTGTARSHGSGVS